MKARTVSSITMGHLRTLSSSTEASDQAVLPPAGLVNAAARLPFGTDMFTEKNLPALTQSFLAWKDAKSDSAPTMADVVEWMRAMNIPIGPGMSSLLVKIFEAASEARNRPKDEIIEAWEKKQDFSWSSFLRQSVDDDRESARENSRENEYHENRKAKAEETHRKEENSRAEIRSLLLHKPLSRDASSVRDLELKLLTKNIPSEDIMEVMQFLAQLSEMQPLKCVRR